MPRSASPTLWVGWNIFILISYRFESFRFNQLFENAKDVIFWTQQLTTELSAYECREILFSRTKSVVHNNRNYATRGTRSILLHILNTCLKCNKNILIKAFMCEFSAGLALLNHVQCKKTCDNMLFVEQLLRLSNPIRFRFCKNLEFSQDIEDFVDNFSHLMGITMKNMKRNN